ncbi:MAG: DUF5107 domain-containing protein, partial [Bradyrhizobium sp.]|uniref:DUF5107 domain-containing protein n=1 Tax=Bradyrhizobium sp. TaxID=376 RepID=UPI001E0B28C0
KPWAFKVLKESAEEVTVAMSLTDDFAFPAPPPKFRKGSTGIEAAYVVTLKAGRAALDARVVLKNPGDRTIDYEYWTCTTLAPGSEPDHPRGTAGAEIIAPVAAYTTPAWSANIAEGDASAAPGRRRFDRLRFFRNWPSMGIAYAAPDMQGGNFWGVINHDNGEGIFRIANNDITRGLKMWTWGFPTFTEAGDPRRTPIEAQPYVELWAGVSDQFFHAASFPAHGEVSVMETYGPSVGLRNVTAANENVLVDLAAAAGGVDLEFFSFAPAEPLHVTLKRGEVVLFDDTVVADPGNGNRVSVAAPAGAGSDRIRLAITAADGRTVIAAETAMK